MLKADGGDACQTRRKDRKIGGKPLTTGLFKVINPYMKKTMTMTLTSKRQTVFPLEWCRREGLERGGPLNVFDLGKDGLLIRPIKAPGQEAVRKLLRQTPVGAHSPRQATAIVNQALRHVREEAGRH